MVEDEQLWAFNLAGIESLGLFSKGTTIENTNPWCLGIMLVVHG